MRWEEKTLKYMGIVIITLLEISLFLRDLVITWSSIKQKVVDVASCEAGYIALIHLQKVIVLTMKVVIKLSQYMDFIAKPHRRC